MQTAEPVTGSFSTGAIIEMKWKQKQRFCWMSKANKNREIRRLSVSFSAFAVHLTDLLFTGATTYRLLQEDNMRKGHAHCNCVSTIFFFHRARRVIKYLGIAFVPSNIQVGTFSLLLVTI